MKITVFIHSNKSQQTEENGGVYTGDVVNFNPIYDKHPGIIKHCSEIHFYSLKSEDRPKDATNPGTAFQEEYSALFTKNAGQDFLVGAYIGKWMVGFIYGICDDGKTGDNIIRMRLNHAISNGIDRSKVYSEMMNYAEFILLCAGVSTVRMTVSYRALNNMKDRGYLTDGVTQVGSNFEYHMYKNISDLRKKLYGKTQRFFQNVATRSFGLKSKRNTNLVTDKQKES